MRNTEDDLVMTIASVRLKTSQTQATSKLRILSVLSFISFPSRPTLWRLSSEEKKKNKQEPGLKTLNTSCCLGNHVFPNVAQIISFYYYETETFSTRTNRANSLHVYFCQKLKEYEVSDSVCIKLRPLKF